MSDLPNICERLNKAEVRLEDHHRRLTDLNEASKMHAEALAANTALTQEVATQTKLTAANTAELVELFKGAKAFRKFILWIVGIGTPVYAVIEAVRHFK